MQRKGTTKFILIYTLSQLYSNLVVLRVFQLSTTPLLDPGEHIYNRSIQVGLFITPPATSRIFCNTAQHK